MKLSQMTEKHRLVTQVKLLRLNLRTNLSESPLLGLDLGGCAPLEQLGNLLSLLHIALREPGMTHSVLTTLWTNQKEQTIKDVV